MRANKSIDTDVLSAGFAGLLSAGHFRRYTTAENRSVHPGRHHPSLGLLPLATASAPRQSARHEQDGGRPVSKVAMSAAAWRQSHALQQFVGHQVERRCELAQSFSAAASLGRTAVGLGAAGSAQSPALCGAEGSRVGGRPSAQSAVAAPQANAAAGAHNKSVETDAQVRPCAARTRLLCAAHLQR